MKPLCFTRPCPQCAGEGLIYSACELYDAGLSAYFRDWREDLCPACEGAGYESGSVYDGVASSVTVAAVELERAA
jgi:hypothetical protein